MNCVHTPDIGMLVISRHDRTAASSAPVDKWDAEVPLTTDWSEWTCTTQLDKQAGSRRAGRGRAAETRPAVCLIVWIDLQACHSR